MEAVNAVASPTVRMEREGAHYSAFAMVEGNDVLILTAESQPLARPLSALHMVVVRGASTKTVQSLRKEELNSVLRMEEEKDVNFRVVTMELEEVPGFVKGTGAIRCKLERMRNIFMPDARLQPRRHTLRQLVIAIRFS
mmetsp:Transcript_4161/g.5111  ORF Transcript_4161/g.5111 Transcript_4161/m.5111 type:complete len:139 (+) Transcript_4161:432-848(+)